MNKINPNVSRIRQLSLAIAMVSGSMAATAQELALEEVVVTAQKRAESVQDIPVSVTAMDSSTIEKLGIQSSADIVRLTPSMTVLESNNKTNSGFSIRGIGTNVYGVGVEQAVAMIIDDVAMPQQGQSMANLVDIERIEVLRGPQSTLFGKAASAGAINITTKAPSEEFEGTIELTATDEDALHIVGSASGPLTDSLGYRVTGYWADRDGYVENLAEGYDDLNGEESQGVRAKFQWDISDTISATLGGYYMEEDSQCCGRNSTYWEEGALLFGVLPQEIAGPGITSSRENSKIINDTLPDAELTNEGLNLRLNFELGEYSLVSITAVDKWEYSNSEDVDGTDFDWLGILTGGVLSGGFYSDSARETDFFSQEFRLVSPSNDQYDYLIGLYYSDSDTDRTFFRNLPVAPADNAVSASTEYIALFGQLNWHFTERTTASIGLRTFEEEIGASSQDYLIPGSPEVSGDNKDDDIVGKASLQHFIAEDTMVFASYTRGYKGQAFDLTGGLTPEESENPISPEIADAFELGMKSEFWDQRLRLNATLFYTEYTDFQTQATDSTSGVVEFRMTNSGDLKTQGLELETITLLSEAFTLTLNASYIDAEINDGFGQQCWPGQTPEQGCLDGSSQTLDGATLPNSPEYKVAALLDYYQELDSLPFDLFANISYTWQDDIIFNINQHPDLTQDAYGLTNLRFGVSDKSGRYEVSLFGNNVFDESYVSDMLDSSVISLGTGQLLAHVLPRNSQSYWGIKAKYNF
ncbi:TonB-dependent receptor [Halioglobus maricola]|uniref:TonB-dependent receptor n=1 Tax=Halioglobus maricola TaxID=2601894 RepID=A0A5P9NKI5_9GAMM|nr:TonB-dependent receptor [Halioglobus maricola]QFU75754.1 TonB-dependent receptor [Halioglobus maricola]